MEGIKEAFVVGIDPAGNVQASVVPFHGVRLLILREGCKTTPSASRDIHHKDFIISLFVGADKKPGPAVGRCLTCA
jgi:hypothetical protein